MNIAQLSEQLKDIPQGTLVNYARDPNSVVPQFLALAEIQRRQQLQTAGAGQPPARTVAEDVLDKANPPMVPQQPQMAQQAQMAALPENQPGVASLPTGMAQGMAGGGIVAFAEGGDAEDVAYQDYLDKAETQKRRSGLAEMFSGLKDRASEMYSSLPSSYETEKAKASGSGIASLEASTRSGHPYEAQAIAAAKQVGLDPNIMLHALYKETGGLKNPETAMSKAGAYGPMQLMEATARELGVNRKDAYENILGGAMYLKQQVDRFKDPTLALAAYNAGPGRVSEMLKRNVGIESLPRETQGYVKMASGGIIGYANRGLVDPEDSLAPGESIVDTGISPVAAPVVPTEANPFKAFLAQQAQEREDIKKGAEQDKYLALMQAGFGMMGGSSPYAFTNIGKGAEQGISTYGALQKQRAAELAAINKSTVTGLEAQHLYDYRQDQLKSLDEKRKENVLLGKAKLKSEDEARQRRATEAEDRFLLSQQNAESAREIKINTQVNQALEAVAKKAAYKLAVKTMGENSPESDEYIRAAQDINNMEYNQLKAIGLEKRHVPYIPTPPAPKKEEPGFLDMLRKGSQNLFGTNQPAAIPMAAPSGRISFDINGNPITQ
jgi:soluble lytic murein transglycosylase-like protein